MSQLVSWRSIPELAVYAGVASYDVQLDLPAAVFRPDVDLILDLGDVYELADVWLNGRRVGTSWFPPHCLDLTDFAQPGANVLRVDVPNILKNHLERGDSARPSGLLGPVRVRPVARCELHEAARESGY